MLSRAAVLTLLLACTSAQAYVIPAFPLPPVLPVPLQPTAIGLEQLDITLGLTVAGELTVSTTAVLRAKGRDAVQVALPMQQLRRVHIAVDGAPLPMQARPVFCQQQAMPGPACQHVATIQVPEVGTAVLQVRYDVVPHPGTAASSLYKDSMRSMDPMSRRTILRQTNAAGVSLGALARWQHGPTSVCALLTGQQELAWLRDVSPAGWFRHGAATLSWYWDAGSAPLPHGDLALVYSPGKPRAQEHAAYAGLSSTSRGSLEHWLHLVTLRQFDAGDVPYRQALERSLALVGSGLAFEAESDPRLDLLPKLVALTYAASGRPAARKLAGRHRGTLKGLNDSLLLQGRSTRPVEEAQALIQQLLSADRLRVCPRAAARPPLVPSSATSAE